MGCKDIEIRKFELVAQTQFLYCVCNEKMRKKNFKQYKTHS